VSRRNYLIVILVLIFLWLQEAEAKNIILKVMAVNPSKVKTQTVNLKAYLPEEATPDDVVDIGDLKMEYDVSRGLYYAFKEVKLGPGENITRSIEMRDIWLVSEDELTGLRTKAKDIVDKLKKTPYFEGAVILQQDIETKSEDILKKQGEARDALPQAHIGAYRKNFSTLTSIKNNVENLEKLLILNKASSGIAVERISVRATWWVILAVIVCLGLISVVLFFIWHRQSGKSQTSEETKLQE